MRFIFWGLLSLGFALASPTLAVDYHVGPGQDSTSIGDVPWASLSPGDRVLIHWEGSPYQEKWVINAQGTVAQPIVVRGIPGPSGERPIIDGNGAISPTNLNYWNEVRGVIKIGGSNTPPDGLPSNIVIEGLEIRSGRPPFTFIDTDGLTQTYSNNAAAIYVEKAENLVIRDCELHDSGNGLFIGVNEGQTKNVLLEGNDIHGNGIVGSIFQHNTYTSAMGIVYQGNRLGPLRSGAGGNNLKDRSAGLVVRYNWIESGNRQLDLVDADSPVQIADPTYRETFVYGNVLIEPNNAGNSQIVHYGGDSGDEDNYRKGDLYFFQNTVVSTRSGNTTLMRLSSADETADVRNNILYVTDSGNRLAMTNSDGELNLSHNWTKAGWVESHDGAIDGSVNDDGTGIIGLDPGFTDEGNQDFTLVGGSDAEDTAGTLHPNALPDHYPARQYFPHLGTEGRPFNPPADLGAFERCPVEECGSIFSDGFESGDFSAWSLVEPSLP